MTTDTDTQTSIAKVITASVAPEPPEAADAAPPKDPSQFVDDEEDDDEEDDIFGAAAKDDDEEDDFAFIEIFDKKCLSCSHLVPFAEKKYKNCHFSAGNKHCPAASTKIVVRIPLEQIATKFLNAEAQGDNALLARLHAKLASKEDWYQQRVSEFLKAARKERDRQDS